MKEKTTWEKAEERREKPFSLRPCARTRDGSVAGKGPVSSSTAPPPPTGCLPFLFFSQEASTSFLLHSTTVGLVQRRSMVDSGTTPATTAFLLPGQPKATRYDPSSCPKLLHPRLAQPSSPDRSPFRNRCYAGYADFAADPTACRGGALCAAYEP